ncbi:calreticulin family protein [Toxoplasma gondii GAB2-2007-GAL-DOM2]|uniref:Calreticulin family protein n=4 Tax=Toxoplasma gondii TaxID=5811 RepID=A0A2T6J2V1_TOXGO|nr:calreticulin family protein [Toxoplasma gondii GAB2-2007-GAL-DOM2]PUA91921.1 calreticulin family protein [Toxoplasma gondii TgCATBr9]
MSANRTPCMSAVPGLSSTSVSSRLSFSILALLTLVALHTLLPDLPRSAFSRAPSPSHARCSAGPRSLGSESASSAALLFAAAALPDFSEEASFSRERGEEDDVIQDDQVEEREEDLLLMQKAATAGGQSTQARPAVDLEPQRQAGEVHGPGDSPGDTSRAVRLLQLRREAAEVLQSRIKDVFETMEKLEFVEPGNIDGILFQDTFQDNPLEKGVWVPSADPKFQGRWSVETRSAAVIAGEKNLVMQDMRKFHGVARRLSPPIKDTLKEHFVFQYELLQTRPLTCGGGYLKLLDFPEEQSLKEFNHLTDYLVMFGPDICGDSNVVHFILKVYNPVTKEWTEHRLDAPPRLIPSPLSNLLTLWIKPDDTFEILIDGSVVRQGSLLKDMVPPLQPAKTLLVGHEAEADSRDEAETKKAAASGIPNPAYFKLEHAHRLRNINAVAMELWTVEGGTAFDNLIFAKSIDAARAFAKKTFEMRRVKEEELRRHLDAVHLAWREEFAEKQRALEAEFEEAKASSSPSVLDRLTVALQQMAEATGLSPFFLAALAVSVVCLLLLCCGRKRRRTPPPRTQNEEEKKKR